MHWLYFDGESPKKLEKAGFNYDSTCGYNEAIGYRVGTSQPFRPIGCSTLMELPMSIMDSALFSSGRMGMTPSQAMPLCRRIIDHARRAGGAIVINWHDRSLAPERLWGRFYGKLLKEIREEGHVWFARALEAVEWFRWRRSIRFHRSDSTGQNERITITVPPMRGMGALLYIHRVGTSGIETETMPIEASGFVTVQV